MAFRAVETHAENLRAPRFYMGDIVAKGARLFGAAGRVVFRIKIEHHPAALIISQALGLANQVDQRKRRRALAFLQFRSACSGQAKDGTQAQQIFSHAMSNSHEFSSALKEVTLNYRPWRLVYPKSASNTCIIADDLH